jgi:hypothetical protein
LKSPNPHKFTAALQQRSEDEGCRAEAHSAKAGSSDNEQAGYGPASQR